MTFTTGDSVRQILTRSLAALVLAAGSASPAFAQDDDPAILRIAEPDFNLIALPTSLRVPTMKSAFRVTHRFQRPLAEGSFGDLVEDLFGLDGGSTIGLEYRFGIIPNGQIGIHRTNNAKTIQFFGQYSVMRQDAGAPLDVSALVTVDGTNNFKDSYSPAIGAILSRTFGDRGAVYVEPMWVNNTNPQPSELVEHNDTFIVGVGTRVRIRPTVYVVGEIVPRVAGDNDAGVNHASFAIEKRAGGHTFQLNFSNSFATTMAQLARGGETNDNWYLGFNISRKFF
jgi:hypothetical protein